MPREEIHFHELSHIDTIIDVLCVARAVAYFNIDTVFCGPVPVGRGFVKTAHGMMPNPPPATTELLSGFKVVFLDEELELTTPTGAAIVRHYVKSQTRPAFRIIRHGCGFGTFETARPNVLRVFIGETEGPAVDEEIWVMEADMDDMETEYMGVAAERIRSVGALDVLYFPVQMKKGRSGIRLSILAPASRVACLDGSGLSGDVDLWPAAQVGVSDNPCPVGRGAPDVVRPGKGEERVRQVGKAREDPHRVRRGKTDCRRAGACRTAAYWTLLRKNFKSLKRPGFIARSIFLNISAFIYFNWASHR